jgi:hypothetical protein
MKERELVRIPTKSKAERYFCDSCIEFDSYREIAGRRADTKYCYTSGTQDQDVSDSETLMFHCPSELKGLF